MEDDMSDEAGGVGGGSGDVGGGSGRVGGGREERVDLTFASISEGERQVAKGRLVFERLVSMFFFLAASILSSSCVVSVS